MSGRVKAYLWTFLVAYVVLCIILFIWLKLIGMAIALLMVQPVVKVMRKLRDKLQSQGL